MTILFNKEKNEARWLDVDGFEPWRGKEFLGEFGGWRIASVICPEFELECPYLYLPGENTDKDPLPFSCPADQMDSVAQALTEWAEKAGVPMEVRWDPTKENDEQTT